MLQTLLNFSLGSIVLVGGLALAIYFLLQYILDPLRDIPGPFLARFTRWVRSNPYTGLLFLCMRAPEPGGVSGAAVLCPPVCCS